MQVATFWQIGEKRVGTGGHESDGYPCQCKFNDVIRRSGDLIFFPKSNILCDLQSHTPQIYIYVLMIHTEDKSFLDYARWSKKVDFF